MADAMRTTLGLATAVALLGGCGAGTGTTAGSTEAPAPAVVAFQYAPFAMTYRLASHTRTEQEFGGQVNAMAYATATYLAVEAVPGGDAGTGLTMHIDSLVPLGSLPPGVSASDLEGVVGATFRGTMAPNGRVLDFQAGEGSGPLLAQLNQSMPRFFSVIPEGGAHPGQTWVDTSTVSAGGMDTDIEITTITSYTAADWVQQGSLRTLPVSAKADYMLSGVGSQGGAEFVLDGTGVSWVEILFADDGRLIERTSADTMNMTASVVSMGAVVPVTQIRADTLTVLR